jgi:hypothetical protein
MGKAIRYPAKNTLVYFAATQVGHGKSFAIQEFLDQLGAFLGPVILFITLYLSKNNGVNTFADYALCFAILGIPALFTMDLHDFEADRVVPRSILNIGSPSAGSAYWKKVLLIPIFSGNRFKDPRERFCCCGGGLLDRRIPRISQSSRFAMTPKNYSCSGTSDYDGEKILMHNGAEPEPFRRSRRKSTEKSRLLPCPRTLGFFHRRRS